MSAVSLNVSSILGISPTLDICSSWISILLSPTSASLVPTTALLISSLLRNYSDQNEFDIIIV
jgi:hypothetical protein